MPSKQFKVSLLGEGGVGKTSLKSRFISGEFTNRYIATLGVDFATHQIIVDNEKVSLQCWDIAGQDHFSSIRRGFFQGSRGGLLVYDVTRKKTFEALENKWVKPFWEVVGKVPCVLMANKIDLIDERTVSSDEGKSFATKLSKEIGYSVPYLETSALNGNNVNKAFESLSREVINRAPTYVL